MLRKLIFATLSISITLCLGSCSRSTREIVEDSKTAGHYIGKSFKSLGGKQSESRAIKDPNAFASNTPDDFIPLRDSQSNPLIASEIDAIPQSSLAPGEPGSDVPGVEGFHAPSTAEQQQIFRNLHFETAKHEIHRADDKQTIKNIADYMQRNPKLLLFVEGHCDERGAAGFNMALGTRRSNSVRGSLVSKGINPDRIFTISFGYERPLVMGHNNDAWQENRRAQFKLYWR
ncbi:MAG: OmpA family protein [Chlamydiales bacterium]|nr:OmpA family protein [Chlamydiales bacterium]NCF70881.1 OmpA family protein [Chlamydiales bacterium]